MAPIRLSNPHGRFNAVLLFLAFLIPFSVTQAQSEAPIPPAQAPAKSGEGLQTRIERARALIAAHRLDTAASELESVRAATQDNAVRNVTSIMLMSVYLEDGNYGRAEALLEETYQGRAAQKDESLGTYFALAGQAVNGARMHLARYRSFGISTTDANLPAEAVNDLIRLRSLLERMIAQAKETSSARKAYDSLSLLEDVLGIRLSLATDSEDQAKWEIQYASAREALASSQTQIASLGGIPLRPARSSANKVASPSPYSTKKASETSLEIKATEKTDSPAEQAAPPSMPDETAVSDAGSLNAKATKKVLPRYPALAKQNGAAGVVRVHVIIDENGKVVAISHSEGPVLLRAAAEEAAWQWSFEGISNGDRPTRLAGYIDFNFTL